MIVRRVLLVMTILVSIAAGPLALAQVAPTPADIEAYRGLHRAAHRGEAAEIARLLAAGADANERDTHGRTPLHVATFAGRHDMMRTLVKGGADPRALESQRYDAVTIAAVKDDVETMKVALAVGGDARAITSLYNGTALIAAAHLGHVEVVRELIRAGAPLDHVNNLGWTALIEAVILGDGGPRHTATVEALVKAGARRGIADRSGATPLDHARNRGYVAMIRLLE